MVAPGKATGGVEELGGGDLITYTSPYMGQTGDTLPTIIPNREPGGIRYHRLERSFLGLVAVSMQ